MIGELLTGRYLVLKKLGAGGFSETYLARDKYLPHHPLCVVKCLQLSANSTISPEIAQQLFETEARVLDQLGQDYAQIPTLFAYCHEPDQVHQVQEYIDGENLGSWIAQNRRLAPTAAIELLLSVLPILDYIHAHHVVHGDIKPSNLIHRHRDGKMVLIDFGAACILSETDACLTANSGDSCLAIGTPGYMPDEQQEGAARWNSDLYALGMSVIHLITGICPQQLQRDPISGELDWQSHLRQAIDPKLVAILNRMVLSNARDRYQRATDVLTALQSLPLPKKHSRWIALFGKGRLMPKTAAAIGLIAGVGLLSGGVLNKLPEGLTFQSHSESIAHLLAQARVLPHQANVHLTLLRDLPIQGAIDQMLIAPNSRILVTAGAEHLRLWSLPNGSMVKSLTNHTGRVTALAMSPDSKLLVSGGEDRSIRLWDVTSGELLREFSGHQGAVTAIAFSADAQTMVSGSKDGTLRLWNLQTGELLQTLALPNAEITAVVYGATANQLISASGDRDSDEAAVRQIQVWDLATGQLDRTFAGHTAAIEGLQAVDEHTLLSFGQDRALLWDLRREELLRVFPDDSAEPVTALLDDQHMMTVHNNGSVRVWTRETGWLLTTTAGRWRNLDAVLSANHRYLVCWSPDQRLRLWQVDATAMQ